MVRPAALYNKARFSRDFTFLGRVVAVMCGNRNIKREELSDAELSALEEIENENDEMEKNLEKAKVAKAKYRAAKAAKAKNGGLAPAAQGKEGEICPQMSEGQTKTSEDNPACPQMSEGQTKTSEDNEGQEGLSSVVLPCPALSSPNNTNNTNNTTNTSTKDTKDNKTRSDPDRAYAYARAHEAAEVGSGSGSVRCFDVYSMPDEELYGGAHDTLRLYKSAFGRGFWSQALRDLGDDVMLEELGQFVHEVRAGEVPKNPGAAMTARLKARIAERERQK